MTKMLIDIPDEVIVSFNEIADLSKKSTNELIIEILDKLVIEYRTHRIELDRLNDDSGIYQDPPSKVRHLSNITMSPYFKIIIKGKQNYVYV